MRRSSLAGMHVQNRHAITAVTGRPDTETNRVKGASGDAGTGSTPPAFAGVTESRRSRVGMPGLGHPVTILRTNNNETPLGQSVPRPGLTLFAADEKTSIFRVVRRLTPRRPLGRNW